MLKNGTIVLVAIAVTLAGCAEDGFTTGADGGGGADSGAGCVEGVRRCVGTVFSECQKGAWQEVERCNASCTDDLGCVDCDPAMPTTCKDGDVHGCDKDGTIGALQEKCVTEPCKGGRCGNPGCEAGSESIYVVDDKHHLLRFEARNDAHTFQLIGTLSCPAGTSWPGRADTKATPFSMSVDRQARAWVLYSSGEVFHVDTKTASCSATSYAKGQQGFELFGMGFVSDAPGSKSEKLYVFGGKATKIRETGKLGSIDPGNLGLSVVGALSKSDQQPELTGTGKAGLFGFFPGASPFVGEIDKQTGQIKQQWPLPKMQGTVTAWAFAHWGGRFYIFATVAGLFVGEASKVLRLDPKTGTVDTLLSKSPYRVVGAGVSTCAPVVID
jgi:hypothetical protein